eukprot:390656-Lingulodinium_polyedra.AAC.1
MEPRVALGRASHEIPANGPTAAQLLHWAACRAGNSPGVNGAHALAVETLPLDGHSNPVAGDVE